MIRSLRAWHRRLIPLLAILLLAILVAALAFRQPAQVRTPLPGELIEETQR